MPGIDDKAKDVIADIWEMVEPVLRSEGFELIEVEYRREAPGWVLRLFIDTEGGVTVDHCARVSQVVGDLLDVADLIQNPYNLEVSSPGLDRPLRKLEHFREYIGKILDVRTANPIDKRRKFKGILVDVTPDQITMDCDGTVFEIPLPLVERARLRYFESFGE